MNLMNNDVFFNEMIKDIEDIRLELVLTRTSKIIYNYLVGREFYE